MHRSAAASLCPNISIEPRGIYRAAGFADGRLAFCLFVGPASQRPRWDVAKALLAAETLADRQRRILLSGQSADGMADAGPLVCACFGVGLNTIREALASGAAADVAGIGKALRAGTNCGSCLPELKRIVAQEGHHDQHARQNSLARLRARPPRMEPLARLPVFFSLHGKRVVVAGGNAGAAWKVELLAAAGAHVDVYATDPSDELLAVAANPPAGDVDPSSQALGSWRDGRLRACDRRLRSRRRTHGIFRRPRASPAFPAT